MKLQRALAVAGCAATLSCGYRPLYVGELGARLHVKLVRTLVPDAVAADEVALGVREELARQGALEGGEGYPQLEVEVLRADETSEGLAASSGAPVARATAVAVLARGWVVAQAGHAPERDSGDLRAEAVISVDTSGGVADPRAGTFHYADAIRSAARRLGHKIARRVMGLPATSEEAEGP